MQLMSERRPAEEQLLTIDQAMEQLNISRNTMVKLMRKGEIRYKKVASVYRFKQSWIDAFIEGEGGHRTQAD